MAESTADTAKRRWLFGPAVVDEASLELSVDGRPVPLERKALQVLLHLLQHAGEVVTKDELLESVWPGRVLSETVLNRCISLLRKALGDAQREIIRTVHGLGYRLDAQLRVEAAAPGAPPTSVQAGDTPPLRPHWRLLERLGYGGHAEAWLARHVKSGQARVFKFALDARSLSSLKREITLHRVLKEGLGERDDVVRLLDWNLNEPPCYLEYEHVAAGDLLAWSDARGGLAEMSLPDRLELLAGIADVVAAAHSVGVLHKDLKPANILVADEAMQPPRIKLTDFGSGGVLDPGRLEQLGITRMGFTRGADHDPSSGTPLYLAPEVQMGQPVTAQGDIYSLGVMLYQFVVGDLHRPLAPGWEAAVDDALLREDIAAAVQGEPGRRLKSAAELAQRLRGLPQRRAERALLEDAVRTRARLAKMRARRGWVLALLLLFAGGAALSTWLYLRADQARTEAEAVSRFVSQDLLALADPNRGATRDIRLAELIGRAAGQIDARLSDQPQAAARLHQEVARSFAWLGERQRSEAHYQRAITLFSAARGADDLATLVARAQLWLTRYEHLWLVSQSDPASDAELLALQAGFRGALPPDHPFVLYMDFVATIQHWREPGRYQALGSELQAILERAEGARPLRPDEVGLFVLHTPHPREIVQLLAMGLSDYHTLGGRYEEALQAIEQAAAIHAEIHPGGSYQRATLLNKTGFLLFQLGRFEQAQAVAERAAAEFARWVDDDAGEYTYMRAGVGFLDLERGRHAQARETFQGIIAHCRRADCQGMKQFALAMAHEGLAGALLGLGQPDRARDAAATAVAQVEAFFPYSAESVEFRTVLAEAELARGDVGAARAALDGINDHARVFLLPESPLLAEFRRAQGLLWRALGKGAEAERALREVLRIETARRDPGHWKIVRARQELAGLDAGQTQGGG